MNYEDFMLRAITEAGRNKYTAKPNPVVGAILVKNNEIISEGYHEKFGENHAEINAIDNCLYPMDTFVVVENLRRRLWNLNL